jgi:hypothetical protein
MVPLIFFFQAFRYARQLATPKGGPRRKRRRARRDATLVIVATLAIAILPTSPLFAGPRMIRRNFIAWTTVDHEANAFDWIRENTPTNTRCIIPVDRQDAFERTERPQVANWQAIPYDRLLEWKTRIDDLVGGPGYFEGPGWHGDLTELRAAYNRLTAEQVEQIADKYDAGCFVTQTQYPFQLLHRDGDVRVYALAPF